MGKTGAEQNYACGVCGGDLTAIPHEHSNSKSEDTLGSNIPKIVEILKAYEHPQDTTIQDVVNGTPKGREAVQKAVEQSIEDQNEMTRKAQDTLKESSNLNTSEEHIKPTSLDEHIFTPMAGGTGQNCSCGKSFGTTDECHQHWAWHMNLAVKVQRAKLFEQIRSEVKAQPTWESSTMIEAEDLLEALNRLELKDE